MTTTALPCATSLDTFDTLLDTAPDTPAYQDAHTQAVQLCATCPQPCTEKITATHVPTVQAFDDTEWIPAPVVLLPLGPTRRRRIHVPPTGRDYVPPARRPIAWARMAADLAAEGQTVVAIAAALCVDEDTARTLLRLNHSATEAA
ncbi:hypothetical protein ACFC26_09560 [Kitasatospora purpeofusca]|uniref:hypothetical protein n=1 Tax=Kitasatospora purpeofusca TaxID=67352 RepID=UPI0035DC4CF4